ncbi:unnamed protein product [Ambrosiozyma monospora]|uniref:Unnamed protein product n=1 Tax=Ambrosiozyma monospora TaxID=43982 RepID=A0ACB5SU47_AMBMO|nr:unnamed protein product [Ambrosiozyma monospora]
MANLYLRSRFSSLREYLTPITHTSTFDQTGEITPDEFVAAGDYLVSKFPTWQWSQAPASKKKDFLPADKQFLVTRHVPSYFRASTYEEVECGTETVKASDLSEGDEEEDGWTSATGTLLKRHCSEHNERRHSEAYLELKEDVVKQKDGTVTPTSTGSRPDDEIDDIDELIEGDDIEEIADVSYSPKDTIVNDPNKRSYDLYITYSTSYRVPKMYLAGFNANGVPLKPAEMFEDIASDYRQKTVTIESAPFLENTTVVSIHPCRHAHVMKVLMKRSALAQQAKLAHEKDLVKGVAKLGLADHKSTTDDEDEWEDLDKQEHNVGVRVDQYLIIFLKFIGSVTPGIEHDYTMDAL